MSEKTMIEEILENMKKGKIRKEEPIKGRSATRYKEKHLQDDYYRGKG